MSEFGGYEMPLWYPAGAKAEHLAVLRAAGVFDTSHMAVLVLEGPDSFGLLQKTFTKDLGRCQGPDKKTLAIGRCVYGLFLDKHGHVIDDAIVYKVLEHRFMLVVNAGMGGVIGSHLSSFGDGHDVTIFDYTDRLGKIDIQGLSTYSILAELLENPQEVLEKLPYFSFKGWFDNEDTLPAVRTKGGVELLLSRTGYTGEFGVELFTGLPNTVQLWQEIIECGQKHGLLPCGLAARDSLRTGALLPLSHQDIGAWIFGNTPWDFVLPLDDEKGTPFTKPFHGDAALQQWEKDSFTYGFAGFDPRKIVPDDKAFVAENDGVEVGKLLTCTTDMAIGRDENGEIFSISQEAGKEGEQTPQPKGLSCGFIRTSKPFSPGDSLLLVSGKRKIKIEIRHDIRPARTARMSMKTIQQKNNL